MRTSLSRPVPMDAARPSHCWCCGQLILRIVLRIAMPAADFVALVSITAVLTAAWIAGSAMSWARAFLAVITIAAVLAAAWIMS